MGLGKIRRLRERWYWMEMTEIDCINMCNFQRMN